LDDGPAEFHRPDGPTRRRREEKIHGGRISSETGNAQKKFSSVGTTHPCPPLEKDRGEHAGRELTAWRRHPHPSSCRSGWGPWHDAHRASLPTSPSAAGGDGDGGDSPSFPTLLRLVSPSFAFFSLARSGRPLDLYSALLSAAVPVVLAAIMIVPSPLPLPKFGR
ncbi:hypothetical protein THAOC_26894, partial [Thalassiosira oceanica]